MPLFFCSVGGTTHSKMAKKIVLTGGTGLIGQALSQRLLEKGYEVAHLSRHKGSDESIQTFLWDIHKGYIEEGALASAHGIIHLAGAGVFDHPWTSSYKKEIIDSRVASAQLILTEIKKGNTMPKVFISASGISIYGNDTGDKLMYETDAAGREFLAKVSMQWEAAADAFSNENIRPVKLRTGIVLSEKGGALERMAMPVKLGFGAPLGTGRQYISWIHIDDLCAMYIYAIEHPQVHGTYNAVAPVPVTNKEFTKNIASVLRKPLWLPNIPPFALKLALGSERAPVILGGNCVSSSKIEREGFKFKYNKAADALKDLLN